MDIELCAQLKTLLPLPFKSRREGLIKCYVMHMLLEIKLCIGYILGAYQSTNFRINYSSMSFNFLPFKNIFDRKNLAKSSTQWRHSLKMHPSNSNALSSRKKWKKKRWKRHTIRSHFIFIPSVTYACEISIQFDMQIWFYFDSRERERENCKR